MNTVGEIIKSKRISKKISIEMFSRIKNFKILLKKLKMMKYFKNDDSIFYIGHLRSYCNFLELDS